MKNGLFVKSLRCLPVYAIFMGEFLVLVGLGGYTVGISIWVMAKWFGLFFVIGAALFVFDEWLELRDSQKMVENAKDDLKHALESR